MSEVTNELLYEVLKAIQTRLGNMEHAQREAAARLSAIQTHLMAVEKDTANIYESMGALEMRLHRVEQRLDIVPEPGQ